MGRPRKIKITEDIGNEAVIASPLPSLRNEKGLISTIEHIYDDNNLFVDWRKMVNPRYLALNKLVWAKKSVDVYAITEDETQRYIKEAKEDELLIKLAGFKDLARLRGYSSVESVVKYEGEKAVCHCTISWLPNFETNYHPVKYTSVASAHENNIDANYRHFVEAIASNRAFCRCVREFLNIHITSQEEMNPNEKVEIKGATNPAVVLEQFCSKNNISFDVVLKFAKGNDLIGEDENPKSYANIPPLVIFSIIEGLKSSQNAAK